MIKLVCTQCGKIWYTADTADNQVCDDCGSILKKENMNTSNLTKDEQN